MDEHTLSGSFEVSLGHPHVLYLAPKLRTAHGRSSLQKGKPRQQNSDRKLASGLLVLFPFRFLGVHVPTPVSHETSGRGVWAAGHLEGNSPFLSARRKICREETWSHS